MCQINYHFYDKNSKKLRLEKKKIADQSPASLAWSLPLETTQDCVSKFSELLLGLLTL